MSATQAAVSTVAYEYPEGVDMPDCECGDHVTISGTPVRIVAVCGRRLTFDRSWWRPYSAALALPLTHR